jgi:branched-chain amino acid transport system ATP-binding protein
MGIARLKIRLRPALCPDTDMRDVQAALEIDDISVAFGGVRAVDRVSFKIEPNELVGVIGPNGAGKTTLFRVMVGTVRPDAGRVVFRNRDITRLSTHERAQIGIGLSHQIVRPLRNMTPLENVALAAGHAITRQPLLSLFKVGRRPALSRAMELLDLVGMADLASCDVGSLPLGYLKRLEVARALALEPKLLLLDEPLAGLNQQEAERMASTIGRIKATGLSIVLIEHNLREIVRISERMIVLESGRVLAQGNPTSVITDPLVRNAYMGTGGDRANAAA